MAFDILEGCVYMVIATAAEVPQVVSLANFIMHMFLFLLIPVCAVGARDFRCER